MTPERSFQLAPKKPYEVFGITEQECQDWRLNQDRFEEIMNDEKTTIHSIKLSSNEFGEFLFVSTSRPGNQARIGMTFYGLGYHEQRERWISDEWFWHQTEIYPSGERECVLARWGLVPSWAKELKFGNRCINARAETIATTPSFRAAYAKRHCLVPLNGFYEWTGEPGHKVKWRIRLKDEPLFALAGLWEWWRDPATQQGVETYTIITTEANAAIAPLHDRMPVIVAAPDYTRWLDAAVDSSNLLVPCPPDDVLIEKA